MKKQFYVLIFSTFMLSSCASLKRTEINHNLTANKCGQKAEYYYTEADLPKDINLVNISTTLINNKISKNSTYIANIIGIIPYLEEYIELKSNKTDKLSTDQRIRTLELRQEIEHKINTASLVISAVSAELNCEEEWLSQIANFLSDKQADAESKLTIGAIVFGATGAILTSGVIKNNSASNTVGISTGVAEAIIGLTMIFNKKKIEYSPQPNVLADIWYGPKTSTLFPAFIWYYLNDIKSDGSSLREEIIGNWSEFGQLDDLSSSITNLYFGTGGKYTSDQLDNRANMFDQLDSHIYLLKQKLMTLSSEIDKI